MFGDLVFGVTTPFGTFGDTVPVANTQLWVNACPEVSEWENQDKNVISTAECKDR